MTSDLIATLTLGVGTKIMCAAHLLIMLYLSVKFHQFCFSCIYIYIKFQKMFHSSDHEKSERERERDVVHPGVQRDQK